MSHEKLRRQILYETARLLMTQQETNVGRARVQAARKLFKGWVKPADLPSEQEIRSEIDRMSNFHQPTPTDRFDLYRRLLIALEKVQQPRKLHPEGDALCHSLQVYDLVCDEVPYDEELLLAALLHDVGWGIDPRNPVDAGLHVLGETITERTSWLIANLQEASKRKEGTIGSRSRRRLKESENYEDLLFLAECDLRGRQAGAGVPDLDEVLNDLRSLESEYG